MCFIVWSSIVFSKRKGLECNVFALRRLHLVALGGVFEGVGRPSAARGYARYGAYVRMCVGETKEEAGRSGEGNGHRHGERIGQAG